MGKKKHKKRYDFEYDDGTKYTRKQLIEALARDYWDCDKEDNDGRAYFTLKEHREFATHVVDTSPDGAVF